MGAYEALAASYDRLTNDVNYGAIVAFYEEILKKEGLKPRTAVDLACGTGSVSAILAGKGLSVIGVDMSEEMLTAAQQKCADLQNPPRFVRQSLQRLCLPRGVDLAVCALDSLDYITNPEDCKEAIRRVWKALNPGGIFIFDVNTPEKLRAMDGQVFLDEDDDVYCVWRGEIPIVGRDIDSRAYIAAAAIDGKTQVDVRGAVLIDAVFSANGINADTHNVAALCRQAQTVFYRRKTWLNKW